MNIALTDACHKNLCNVQHSAMGACSASAMLSILPKIKRTWYNLASCLKDSCVNRHEPCQKSMCRGCKQFFRDWDKWPLARIWEVSTKNLGNLWQPSSPPLKVRWSSMYVQMIQKKIPENVGTAPVISLLKAEGPGHADSLPLDGTMLLFGKVAAVLGKMPANSLFNCTLTRPDFRLESWDISRYMFDILSPS